MAPLRTIQPETTKPPQAPKNPHWIIENEISNHQDGHDPPGRVASMTSPSDPRDQIDLVRQHYGAWAPTYGDPTDDGWFAHVRAREVRLVDQMLALRGGESILDAGCGPGIYAGALKQRGHQVWAVDICPEMIARIANRVDHAQVADVRTLDLGRTFDRVLCLGVLEYVSDAIATLRRLRDHLAPEGRGLVLVPRRGIGGSLYRREKRRHGLRVQLYSAAQLRDLAGRAGLAHVGHRYPFFHNVLMAFAR
jgi:SAM-dependent methyltransferase